MSRQPNATRAPTESRFSEEPKGEEGNDSEHVPIGVLEGDEVAWRAFVACHDAGLRAIVRQATEATYALTHDQIDDVMGDFWLAAVANDMRLLRSFTPERGSSLLTWLTFHVANIANTRVARLLAEPHMVPLEEALHIPAPWPRPARARRPKAAPTLPSGRRYSPDELALVTDFALFLVKLGCDGKLDEEPQAADRLYQALYIQCSHAPEEKEAGSKEGGSDADDIDPPRPRLDRNTQGSGSVLGDRLADADQDDLETLRREALLRTS